MTYTHGTGTGSGQVYIGDIQGTQSH